MSPLDQTLVMCSVISIAACQTAPPPVAKTPDKAPPTMAQPEMQLLAVAPIEEAPTPIMLACIDLQEHVSDLIATDYIRDNGLEFSADERAEFLRRWRAELAAQGTFDRFDTFCVAVFSEKFHACGMAADTTDAFDKCVQAAKKAKR